MKYNNPLISVLVATYNRPQQLLECLRSLSNSKFKNFEVIIVDQSINNQANQYISAINLNFEVINIHTDYIGKAKALNLAINRARAEIFAFTDDDCIVDKNWLKEIYYSFHLYPKIVGVFGNTLPYKNYQNPRKICPCIFTKSKLQFISQPCKHWEHIGFGNNMSFRRNVFTKIGNFKSWLGPGSIGNTAEDAELSLRCLIKQYPILHSPIIVVYHNKWLTPHEMKWQNYAYICGEMACYGYFYFQGREFAKVIVLDNIHDSYFKMKKVLKKILLLQWNKNLICEMLNFFFEILYSGRGLLVGFIYSLIDPIN